MKKHPFLYSCALLVLLWALASMLLHKAFVPSPYLALVYLLQHLQMIIQHMLTSLLRILAAICFAVLLGSGTGILTAQQARIDRWVTPLLYTLYPVPKIAFLPLLMLFFGLGNASKIILVSLILFFQIAIAVRDSVKTIPPAYLLSIKSLGASKGQIYRHVIVPAILPNLFTALRITVGTSISVLFFAENFATRYGIGYFIMDSWLKLDYTAMFAGIVAISLMGSGLFGVLDLLEKKVCKWI